MSNLDAVSEEVFRIMRSYDYEVSMYDDEGSGVFEPSDARRFYAKKQNITVSVEDANEDSKINLYLSKSTPIGKVLGLIDSLKMCATKYNMMFDNSRNFKADIEPKQVGSGIPVSETKESMKDLTEGMYGTSRSSYLKLENARMIVRHGTRINENSVGARTRNVDKIFVENDQGERFLMPTRQLAPARAMTQHFNHGGSFADDVGSQINRMTQDFASLGACNNYVEANAPMLAEGALALTEKCQFGRKSIKESFTRLFRESTYAEEAEALKEAAPILAEDAAIQSLREMLTIEGKDLDESILEAVARHCGREDEVLSEDGDGDEDGGPKKRENWDNIQQVKVVDKLVNKTAWDDFLAGKLDMNHNVAASENNPRFAKGVPNAEIAYKLQEVAKRCMDSSMANLLAYVADMLADPPSKGARMGGMGGAPEPRKLMMIAKHALSCAGVKLSESVGLGFRGSKVIREFEDWFNSTMPERVLSEMSYPDDFRGMLPGEDGSDEEFEAVMEEIAGDFRVEDFINSVPVMGSTEEEARDELESYLRNKIQDPMLRDGDLTAYVDDLFPQVATALGLDDSIILDEFEDESFDDAAVREHIADKVRDGEHMGVAHDVQWSIKITDENRSDRSSAAYVAKLIRQGHTEGEHPHWKLTISQKDFGGLVEGEELEEADELTREDVLLPKDATADLRSDVMTKADPAALKHANPMSEPDAGEKMIAELTRLAGMRK